MFCIKVYVNLIGFLLEKGESALKAYQKALEIDPNHKLSIVNYGRQLKMMGNYKEAEVMYRRFVSNAFNVCLFIGSLKRGFFR